jgi:hypothetical protein
VRAPTGAPRSKWEFAHLVCSSVGSAPVNCRSAGSHTRALTYVNVCMGHAVVAGEHFKVSLQSRTRSSLSNALILVPGGASGKVRLAPIHREKEGTK